MKYVGKVGVKVVPDTKRFDATMRRIESEKHSAVIDVIADYKRIREQRDQIQREMMGDSAEIEVQYKAKADELEAVQKDILDWTDRHRQQQLKYTADVTAAEEAARRLEDLGLKTDPKSLRLIEEARKEYEHLNRVVREGQKALVSTADTLDGLRGKAEGVSAEMEKLYSVRGIRTVIEEGLTDQLARAEKHAEKVRGELQSLEDLGDMGMPELQEQLRSAQARVDALDASIEKARRQKKKSSGFLAELPDAVADLEAAKSAVQRLQKQMEETANRKISLEVDVGNALTEVARVRERLEGLADLSDREVIDIAIDVQTEKLDKLREDVAALSEDRAAEIKVDIKKAQANISKLETQLRRAKTEDAQIEIGLNLKKAYKELNQLKIQLQTVGASAEVELDMAKAEAEIQRLTETRELLLQTDVDAGVARAQLAFLARKRFAEIAVYVTGAAKASAVLKGLSGVNMLERFRNKLLDVASGLDMTILRMGLLAPAIGSVVALLFAAVPGLLNFAYGLGKIAPAALALPALFSAIGISVGVLLAAFRNLSETSSVAGQEFYSTWRGVKDQLDAMKPVIQEIFFSQGTSTAFQNLADVVLPQLRDGVERVAAVLGSTFAGSMDTLREAFDNGRLTVFFDQLVDAMERAEPGIEGLVRGFTELSLVAGQFLPEMGDWLADIGTRFQNWASDTEKVTNRIEEARRQFTFLSRGTKAFGRAMDAIVQATANGESGFAGFARSMEAFERFVKNPAVTAGLSDMFSGASDGLNSIFTKINSIPKAFGLAMTFVGALLQGLTEAFGNIVVGFATAFAQPVALGGIRELMEALKVATAGIDWAGIGLAIGMISSQVADLMPYVTDIINSIISWLPSVISFLGGIAEKLMAVVAFLAPIAPAIFIIIAAGMLIGKVVSVILWLKQAWEMLSGAIQVVSAVQRVLNVTMLANPIGIVILAILALIAVLVYLWNTNDEFRAAATTAWENFREVVGKVVEWFKTEVGPGLAVIMQVVGTVMTGVLSAMNSAWANHSGTIMNVITTIMQAMSPLFAGIRLIGKLFGESAAETTSAASTMEGSFGRVGEASSHAFGKVKSSASSTSSALPPLFASMEASAATSFGNIGASAEGGFGRLSRSATTATTGINTDWAAMFTSMGATSTAGFENLFANTSGGMSAISTDMLAQSSVMGTGVGMNFDLMSADASAQMSEMLASTMGYSEGMSSGITGNADSMASTTASRFAAMNARASQEAAAMQAATSAQASTMAKSVGAQAAAMQAQVAANAAQMNASASMSARGMAQAVSSSTLAMSNSTAATMGGWRGMMVSSAQQAMSGFVAGVQQGANYAQGVTAQIPGSLQGAMGYMGGLLFGHGASLIDGLVSGIQSRLWAALEAIRSLASQIVSAAANALAIHSPSRVFHELGTHVPEGLALGVSTDMGLSRAVDGMVGMVLGAESQLNKAFDGFTLDYAVNANVSLPKLRPDRVELDYEAREAAMSSYGADQLARAFAKYIAPEVDAELSTIGGGQVRGIF